jgi:hypothetical protein
MIPEQSAQTRATEFFQNIVLPNIKCWEQNITSLRHAFNAAVSLHHIADYFWVANHQCSSKVFGCQQLKDFRQRLGEENEALALLRDVADGFKHIRLDRSSRKLTEIHQINSRATGQGEVGFGEGTWGGKCSVVICLDDASVRHLSTVIKLAKQFWEEQLQ